MKLLNIITALSCEARPLIDYFRLRKIQAITSFPVFANADQTIHLIVSGIGKTNVAAATGFLHAFAGNHKHCCYLNVGIAGSGQHKIGECVVANKIIDNETERASYPYLNPAIKLAQATLITYAKPKFEYHKNAMQDMEASAFFQAVTQFVTQEQVSVVKIISDHCKDSAEKINPKLVTELISNQIESIASVVNMLLSISQKENLGNNSDHFNAITSTIHFTYYQQQQLQALLRRWQNVYPNLGPKLDEKNANDMLDYLEKKLQETEYTW